MYNEKIMTPIKEEIKEQKQDYFFGPILSLALFTSL